MSSFEEIDGTVEVEERLLSIPWLPEEGPDVSDESVVEAKRTLLTVSMLLSLMLDEPLNRGPDALKKALVEVGETLLSVVYEDTSVLVDPAEEVVVVIEDITVGEELEKPELDPRTVVEAEEPGRFWPKL